MRFMPPSSLTTSAVYPTPCTDGSVNSFPPSSSPHTFYPTPLVEIQDPIQSHSDPEPGQYLPSQSAPKQNANQRKASDQGEELATATSHIPSNSLTSAPGPSQYANVQIALADLSLYATSKLFNPTCPISVKNHFLPLATSIRGVGYMYGPGKPPSAWKPSAVSSVITGPLTWELGTLKSRFWYNFRGLSTFMDCDLLCRSLNFVHFPKLETSRQTGGIVCGRYSQGLVS
jgi:hypothetical protein